VLVFKELELDYLVMILAHHSPLMIAILY